VHAATANLSLMPSLRRRNWASRTARLLLFVIGRVGTFTRLKLLKCTEPSDLARPGAGVKKIVDDMDSSKNGGARQKLALPGHVSCPHPKCKPIRPAPLVWEKTKSKMSHG
jgi:hypothetical protein